MSVILLPVFSLIDDMDSSSSVDFVWVSLNLCSGSGLWTFDMNARSSNNERHTVDMSNNYSMSIMKEGLQKSTINDVY